MARTGRPSKGERGQVLIRLEQPLLQEIKVHCAAKGIELSDTLAAAISAWWLAQEKDRRDAQEIIEKKKAS